MSRLFCALVALIFIVGGCAVTRQATLQPEESFPGHYVQFDAIVSWQVRQLGPDLVVDGQIKNVRYERMDNIEVWVEAFDATGKKVARGVALIVPHSMRLYEAAPFSVRLLTPALPATKLRFTYKYQALDGAGPRGGGDTGFWMQSFDAAMPSLQSRP